MSTPAGTPIHRQFRIIGGLSIRFAEGEGRNDEAFPLRLSGSDREWVVTGLAAAGASSGRGVR